MKLWRAEFGIDNGYSGIGYKYFADRRSARQYAEQNHDGEFSRETCKAVLVNVPTNKKELIAFLNEHHSQAEC